MCRSQLLTLALAAALLLPACERADELSSPDGAVSSTPPASTPSTSPSPTFSAEGYLFTSEEGIRALASFRGTRGRLEVRNTTGRLLGAPGLYLLHARTGEVIAADVSPRRSVPEGATRRFTVALTRDPGPNGIGLVVLTLGGEDHGAFLPPAGEDRG